MTKPINPPSQMLRRTSKIDLPAIRHRQATQVEKLIAELCPEGVEFKELDDILLSLYRFYHKALQYS